MKKIIMIISAFATISAVSVNVAASTVPTYECVYSVSPYYQSASDAISTLTISGTTAKCESKIMGHSDVTSCKVEQTLEKHSGWFWIWNDVASWNNIISGSSGTISVTNNSTNDPLNGTIVNGYYVFNINDGTSSSTSILSKVYLDVYVQI